MDSINYNNRKLRIGAALVASIYIVLHGRLNLILTALTSLSFYIALTVSFSIALLLVYYVHKITISLDEHVGWRNAPVRRSILQFVIGIIIPSFIDIFFVWIYFTALGKNIMEIGFFLIDFPIIIAFLTILNLYYLIHYLLLTEPKETKDHSKSAIENIQSKKLTIEHGGATIQFVVTQDILYFYRFRNRVNLFAFNGKEYRVKETLGAVAEQFKDCGFIQINRSLVLNFSIAEDYKTGTKRNTLELIFNKKYFSLLESQGIDRFVVTKEHMEQVRNFFKGSS